MISIRPAFLALLCGLAATTAAPPARSAIFIDTAPLSSPPVMVAPGGVVPLVFDFGRSFASIASAQFLLTFEGDLWDPNELWELSGVGGRLNITGVAQSSAPIGVNPSLSVFFADLLDGTIATDFIAYNRGGPILNSSFGLASVALQIDATPLSVPEPAALPMFAAGLIGLALTRRRRDV